MKYFIAIALIIIATVAVSGQSSHKVGKIAVLPALNITGDKNTKMCQEQLRMTRRFLLEFYLRGFDMNKDVEVKTVLEETKIDLKEEKNLNRENFYALGEKLGAEYVFFVEIVETGQRQTSGIIDRKFEGWATLKVWFLKVDGKEAILDGKVYKGISNERLDTHGELDKGSSHQIQAVLNGLNDTFKDFFKGFPKVRKIGK